MTEGADREHPPSADIAGRGYVYERSLRAITQTAASGSLRSVIPGNAARANRGCTVGMITSMTIRRDQFPGRHVRRSATGQAVGARPRRRAGRVDVQRRAHRDHRAGPARRGARLRPLLGRRAPQLPDDRQHVAARADRPPRGVDVADPHRLGRRDAAQPPAARRRRAVRHAGGAASWPHRPRHRAGARHRPGDRRRAAPLPDGLGAEDFPSELIDVMGMLGDRRREHGVWDRFQATPELDVVPGDRAARVERLLGPARRAPRPALRASPTTSTSARRSARSTPSSSTATRFRPSPCSTRRTRS